MTQQERSERSVEVRRWTGRVQHIGHVTVQQAPVETPDLIPAPGVKTNIVWGEKAEAAYLYAHLWLSIIGSTLRYGSEADCRAIRQLYEKVKAA